MDKEFVMNLILNAALLLSISIIYNALFVRQWRNKILYNVLLGLIIGIVGILLILNTVSLTSGIIFDTRSILICTTGMFFGPVPTVIAILLISGYRVYIGGAGALAGILVTVLTGMTGLLWHYVRLPKIRIKNIRPQLDFYLVGVLSHMVMLACMLALPSDRIIPVLKAISFPVMLVYPFATLLLSLVIYSGFTNLKMRQELIDSELNFRAIFEQSPIGIAIVRGHRVIQPNMMFEKITGRSKEDLLALDWEAYTHQDDLEKDRQQFQALESGEIDDYSMLKRYIKADGSVVWVNMMVVYLKIKNTGEKNHLCMIQDITAMMEASESLRQSENSFKNLYHEFQDKQFLLMSLINSIPDLIFYKNLDGVYMGCNDAFCKFVGFEQSKIVGYNDFDIFDKDAAAMFREMDQIMIEQKHQRRNEESVIYPDGSTVYLETLKTPFYDPQGNVVGLIGISRDITERKDREEKILYLNYHDVMTDLYNRTFFDEESKRMDKEEFLPLSVIIGDINGLKLINDAFGHAKGDKLLIETAILLKQCCREDDVIARTGGDEFSILLPRTDAEQARKIFEIIQHACQEHTTGTERDIYYTSISLGYATKTKKDEAFSNVIKMAEEYMYRRKLLESRSLHSSIISSIRTTMFEKSDETEMHAERLAYLSRELGKTLCIGEEDLVSLELVSTLHDIGKISLDRNILTKNGKLTEEEWIEIRKHPEVGFRIAQTVPELRRISEYILCHHERWDGKGYPQGLSGEEIPLLSRIISVVDSFDAMTQDRSYRKAMTKEMAIEEIIRNAGTQFDPEIAKIFVEQVLSRI
jgi:diguanylate cyclase (GGDEF)-like protein/PAS domain S-box-containing protein